MWRKLGAKFEQGWGAVVRRAGRLDVAHIVRSTDKQPEIRLFDSFAIDSGEGAALASLAQARNLKRYRCATLLGEAAYRLVQIEAPAVPVEERAEATRWRLKDMVDFPVDGAAIAVVDIPGDSGRQAQVFAIAAPREAVGDCMEMFRAAKIPLEAIDIPEMALRNVAKLFEEENRGLAFLSITQSDCLLIITLRGELCLSRHIDLSSTALAQADEERRGQLLERLALELQRTLDNFDRQYSYIPVSRLVLASEYDAQATLAALAVNLYLSLQLMDLAQVAEFPSLPELRSLERQAQGVYAIGAALREEA